MSRKIRVASGQGFWGDLLTAPVDQVRKGPIDYLMLDYLAEVTMSILQKQRDRDPNAGYARDFIALMQEILPDCVNKNIKVISNAGGVNIRGCADAVRKVAGELGLSGKLKIGIITGDDILPKLDDFVAKGFHITNMETGEPLESVRSNVRAANVYLGAGDIVKALEQNAQIVIGGRLTDTGLTLGPLAYEFGWNFNDWDKMAAGTIAGHIIECGAQASGGNCQYQWQSIPNLADVGFPIIEAEENGEFVVTKHPGTGGRVSVQSVTEQLLYEMGDPKEYITPDVTADFTSIHLETAGEDRVRVFGIKGKPNTDFYKVSIAYSAGWKAVGTLVYAWPDAYEKAKAADLILRSRLDRLGLKFDQILTEFVGVNATHGHLSGEPSPDIPEVQLRVGVRGQDRAAVERFTKEIAPLILTGPPAVTGFAGGRPKVEEIMAYFPALIPKSLVETSVEIIEV
ncbi:MAG: acyclic terpene utilization AtuA family protein [Acidobacteriota bacterium]